MSGDAHRHFHDQLNDVKVRLLTMSGEAEAALGLAVEALLGRDGDKAKRKKTVAEISKVAASEKAGGEHTPEQEIGDAALVRGIQYREQ